MPSNIWSRSVGVPEQSLNHIWLRFKWPQQNHLPSLMPCHHPVCWWSLLALALGEWVMNIVKQTANNWHTLSEVSGGHEFIVLPVVGWCNVMNIVMASASSYSTLMCSGSAQVDMRSGKLCNLVLGNDFWCAVSCCNIVGSEMVIKVKRWVDQPPLICGGVAEL